jgi:hypothetical protein
MSDREMALRFCAFRHFSSDEYSQATSLDAFLLLVWTAPDGIKGARMRSL